MKYQIISSKEVKPEHFNIIILYDKLIISYFDLHISGYELVYNPFFMLDNVVNTILQPSEELYNIADTIIKDLYANPETHYAKPKSKKLYITFFILILFLTSCFFFLKKLNIIPFLVIAACLWQYKGDHWHSAWAFVLALCALFSGVRLAQSTKSIFVGAWFSYTLIMGIWVFAWRDNYYQSLAIPMSCSYDTTSFTNIFTLYSPKLCNAEMASAYAVVSFMIMAYAVTVLQHKHKNSILKGFYWACLLNSVVSVVVQSPVVSVYPY